MISTLKTIGLIILDIIINFVVCSICAAAVSLVWSLIFICVSYNLLGL